MNESLSDFVPFLTMLSIAGLLVPVFHRLHASPILAYLITGVIVGPSCLNLVPQSEITHSIAELGIMFLMFSIGLELSFRRLIVMHHVLLTLGPLQFVLTAAFIGLIAHALGLPPIQAGVVGAALALSSTAIVTQLLIERGEWQTPSGRTAFAMLIFQDITVALLIILLPFLEPSQSWATIIEALAWALLQALGALIIVIILGQLFARPLLTLVANQGVEALTLIVLMVVLGTGWIASFLGGLSMAIGAFLGGLAIAETEFKHQVHLNLQPFRDLSVGLFFIAVGMTIHVDRLVYPWFIIVAFVIGLMATKAAILAITARILGFSQGKRIGLLLSQGSEFSFILLQMADDLQLILPHHHVMIATVVVLSMMLTPLLVNLSHAITSHQPSANPSEHPALSSGYPLARFSSKAITFINAQIRQHPLTQARLIRALSAWKDRLAHLVKTQPASSNPTSRHIRPPSSADGATPMTRPQDHPILLAKGEQNMSHYWVIGGRYQDRSFTTLAPNSQEKRLGPYTSYQEAYSLWAEQAWASADDALTRWQITSHPPRVIDHPVIDHQTHPIADPKTIT